ncbi:hypothetical protein [Mycobacterium sp. 852002-40037_SCH5390672]|uniref:hypothetical protein n=1 Tax=Mycobacterium sp. 852002-40037_SCH5390672 TaxID=1834089 RepID=UPI0012E7E1F9|nr:hypothetical protein [Mycobacterium sp. 852002-40037_SCH5390672]
MNVNESRVRQRRLARTLWAINDNGGWVFPALQFETDPQTGLPHKQIRGLDRVFAALAPNLHPVAVAGFLRTPIRIWHCKVARYIRWSGFKAAATSTQSCALLRRPTGPADDA